VDHPAGAEPAARRGRRLADIVHEQISRLIARGEFPRDLRLPSEEELAGRFGVSRPVIRDALARLRDEGWVRSTKGSGTVVVRGEAPGLRFPPIRTVADLLRSYEFRITVEGATAALAARQRDAAALADIAATLDASREALEAAAYHLLPDLNFAFHRAVARATRNPFFLATLEMIPNMVGRTVMDRDDAEHWPVVLAEHDAIHAAIRDRDPHRARSEMERHIAAARDTLLERQTIAGGELGGR
jgi:GntR family transcriptional regulator, transcriptional repressor for pyruvate dehydrogenase complex